jgi:hypothetical protein
MTLTNTMNEEYDCSAHLFMPSRIESEVPFHNFSKKNSSHPNPEVPLCDFSTTGPVVAELAS